VQAALNLFHRVQKCIKNVTSFGNIIRGGETHSHIHPFDVFLATCLAKKRFYPSWYMRMGKHSILYS